MKETHQCIVCCNEYKNDEWATTCLWIHIIRKDKLLKKLTKTK